MKKRAIMIYLTAQDEQRLKELQDLWETPSVTETMRQAIRKQYTEKIENRENTKELITN